LHEEARKWEEKNKIEEATPPASPILDVTDISKKKGKNRSLAGREVHEEARKFEEGSWSTGDHPPFRILFSLGKISLR
jgi:hypothetical protein